MQETLLTSRPSTDGGSKLSRRVANYLKDEIDRKAIRVGDPLPSRVALSKKFKVSPATISSAINQLSRHTPLKWVPGKGVFLSGKSGTKKTTFTIAVIGWYVSHTEVPEELVSLYWMPIFKSLLREAQLQNDTFVWIPNTDCEPLDIERIISHNPDCVVSFGLQLSSETVTELRRRGVLLVSGNRQLERLGVSYVDYDTVGGIEEMVRVFFERGHRRIATIVTRSSIPKSNEYNRQRFCEALMERKCIYDYFEYWRVLEKIDTSNPMACSKAFAREQARILLDMPEPPTALYCLGEWMATAVAEVATERGLEIGKDLSIIITGCAESKTPFSVLAEPHDELARKLLETTRKIAENPHEVYQIDVAKSFVDRGSVASL